MLPHDVPPKPPSDEREPWSVQWYVLLILAIAIYLLAIWWGFPDWLHSLLAERISPSTNC